MHLGLINQVKMFKKVCYGTFPESQWTAQRKGHSFGLKVILGLMEIHLSSNELETEETF